MTDSAPPARTTDDEALDHGTAREISGALMRQQAALSIGVAAIFLILVFGLPLLTHFRLDIAQIPVLGFPFSWFLLGVFFYPLTWALSVYFVKASEQLEAEEASRLSSLKDGRGVREAGG